MLDDNTPVSSSIITELEKQGQELEALLEGY